MRIALLGNAIDQMVPSNGDPRSGPCLLQFLSSGTASPQICIWFLFLALVITIYKNIAPRFRLGGGGGDARPLMQTSTLCCMFYCSNLLYYFHTVCFSVLFRTTTGWPYKFNIEIYLIGESFLILLKKRTLLGGIFYFIKNTSLSQCHNASILLIRTSSRQVIST